MRIISSFVSLSAAVVLGGSYGSLAAPVTSRISVGAAQVQGIARSGSVSLSADGAFAVFISDADNLVAGDTNGVNDIFVHSLQTGVTIRVSRSSSGEQANGGSIDWHAPAISADGRIVAFASTATNLVTGAANGVQQIFVHDRQTGTTACVSMDASGVPGGGASSAPSLSADGKIIAFTSYATNLAAGDPTGTVDVYIRNLETGWTARVSVAPDGSPANGDSGCSAISGNGRFVAFASNASNLVPMDINGETDIFVRDLQTGITTLVSAASDGTQGNGWSDHAPTISTDGTVVAFLSAASNLAGDDTNGVPDVYVRNLRTKLTTRASIATSNAEADDASFAPTLSASGRYVAFASNAANLSPGDANGTADVFVHDVWLSQTTLVSTGSNAAPGNGVSGAFYPPATSGDGRTVAFESWAYSLVAGDSNEVGDVFARGPLFASPALSTSDVLGGLRAVGGLDILTAVQKTRLNIENGGGSTNVLDILDAIRIARIAAGLE